MKLLDMVKGQVHFQFYREGKLFYKTDCGFEFSVPCEDTGNGLFLRDDKAILFMRYIRKEMDKIKEYKEEIKRIEEGAICLS